LRLGDSFADYGLRFKFSRRLAAQVPALPAWPAPGSLIFPAWLSIHAGNARIRFPTLIAGPDLTDNQIL
jgi:hypothetical protein